VHSICYFGYKTAKTLQDFSATSEKNYLTGNPLEELKNAAEIQTIDQYLLGWRLCAVKSSRARSVLELECCDPGI